MFYDRVLRAPVSVSFRSLAVRLTVFLCIVMTSCLSELNDDDDDDAVRSVASATQKALGL